MRENTRDKSGTGPRKKRRRKHSRSHKQKDEQPQHGSQLALSTSSSLDKSSIEAKDVRAPLSPDEIAEMKEHLQFLLKHRQSLQLKINAKEDLLINGSREPSERGVCMHLLRKVDKSCVEKALRRTPDAQTRTQLLQGIVRFSSDAGLLILYLESLRETESRSQAAAALSLGLKRIDFDKASKAQMSRVLDLIQSLFPKESL
ncbi:MAG TPA: hypothetical protein EYN66_16365, partial [Myxococcales bacterium]|nr:hypothetical protein [Myxococcales bacterium]